MKTNTTKTNIKQINVLTSYFEYIRALPICGIYIRVNRIYDFIELLNKQSKKGIFTIKEQPTNNWRLTKYTLFLSGLKISESTSPNKLIENLGNRFFLATN